MINRFRIRWAFRAGKIEHKSARLCFVAIIGSIVAYCLDKPKIALILTIISALLWVMYYVSHRVEKWLYPSNLRS